MNGAKISLLVILVVSLLASACIGGMDIDFPFTPPPGPTLTRCEIDRNAIQAALDSYFAQYRKWPTADGTPGDIDWDKLVPAFLAVIPPSDSKCNWQVNSAPKGDVCLWQRC